MSKTKAERLAEVHSRAKAEFNKTQSAVRDVRMQALKDRRFYSIPGAQWEGDIGLQFANKPKFEVNKIHLSIIRIINEYRNNRISVTFTSKDGESADKIAEACAALYRADEQESTAEEAYDNAFEEAVGGGMGAWRLRTCYEDDEDEDKTEQRIKIEPIFDADTCVFFNVGANRQDKADAQRCWVLTGYTKDGYEDEWGHADFASWPKSIHQSEFDWLTPDVVYVAEYYEIEKVKENVYYYRGLDGTEERYRDIDFKEDEELADKLAATGWREVRRKKIKTQRVHKYIMDGNSVLEDCGYIAGKYIPIVVTYGKRWFVDNIERFMGHVSLARDAQMLKNMQISKLAEFSAYSSLEKPIFTPQQMLGHGNMWAKDNINNYPYMLINEILGADGNPVAIGPQAYTRSPQVPPAMAALLQMTEQDMQDLLGNQQAGEQLQPNMSGKAVELIQTRLDMQTFIYMSNMRKAVKRSGEIWLSIAKDIIVEPNRIMKGIDNAGNRVPLELKKPVANESGETEYENDLAGADLEVVVDVGPSSASKKQATVRELTGMMSITQDPETMQVLSSMAMMNMEGEGIGEVRDFFRQKLIRMGAVKPTEEEQKELAAEEQNKAAMPPDANTQFLLASADQAQAAAVKARADTVLTVAKSHQTQADTLATLSGIELADQQHALEVAKALDASLGGPQ